MKTARAKWATVLEAALTELSDGAYTPGARFHTLEQFCEKYQISKITGRHVFRELKQRGLITITNGRGGTLVTGCNRVTDVFMCLRSEPNADEKYWVTHTQSFQQFLEGFQSGQFSSLYRVTPITLGFFMSHLEEFVGKAVIISAISLLDIFPDITKVDQALLGHIQEKIHPIIFQSYWELPGVTQVGTDRYAGIRKLVAHLADAGHTRIGYLTGPLNNPWFYPRFKGFIDGLFDAGIAFDPAMVCLTSGTDRDENYRAVETMLQSPHPPTAIMSANDSRALYVLDYCREQHIAVPGTLAVTGFDNMPESALTRPPLTTIDKRDDVIGRTVLDLLHQQQTGKLVNTQRVLIEPELIIRASG